LFFDTGLEKSAYSILEQGKIDITLDQARGRRYIFEEGRGITRFKTKSIERTKNSNGRGKKTSFSREHHSASEAAIRLRKAQAAGSRFRQLEKQITIA
jgi:chromosome segregation protein